jgi:hypothetical protein
MEGEMTENSATNLSREDRRQVSSFEGCSGQDFAFGFSFFGGGGFMGHCC